MHHAHGKMLAKSLKDVYWTLVQYGKSFQGMCRERSGGDRSRSMDPDLEHRLARIPECGNRVARFIIYGKTVPPYRNGVF